MIQAYRRVVNEAYPRTSGATAAIQGSRESHQGLSPHERGNRHQRARVGRHGGPIPARAGQPVDRRCGGYIARAYPRTSGATASQTDMLSNDWGLSPHERGNPSSTSSYVAAFGPIPARAGQPMPASAGAPATRAYPRTSGATMPWLAPPPPAKGLSPHERGNRRHFRKVGIALGPIPARAGQPASPAATASFLRAYPRTSGATYAGKRRRPGDEGLSPHERGNPSGICGRYGRGGPIPARAGQPTCEARTCKVRGAYPRTSGATDLGKTDSTAIWGLSPHERGNRETSFPARSR